MRQSGDDREVVAVIFEQFQVRRELVVFARVFGEEIIWTQSQRRANADHPPPRLHSACGCAGRREGIETGQSQCNAGGPENLAASEFHSMYSGAGCRGDWNFSPCLGTG